MGRCCSCLIVRPAPRRYGMRSFCKLATVMLALIGASVACALALPAFAAKMLALIGASVACALALPAFAAKMLALIGASVACALALPAFAKPANQRQHHGGADLYGTPARYASP